ncbi:zinc finger, CCHC-type, Retrotransposon gag domain protein [Artemisia annua]|uniref:Zinc finger, CCHC-type, Retrotransposon gag domain protein n=1 Tax=Artemisia annua TaxID=35608 RepID=A0A2U1NRC8_ARTAN|nr:zinc finger, CCHC-type, Retrotransposon gag domain protein [Artemisia annua]
MGFLDPIVSNRWLTAVEGAFRTSGCEERKSSTLLIFFAIVLRLGGKERFVRRLKFGPRHVHGRSSRSCLVRYDPVEEIDKIREKFQSLMQTNETVNELWKKFNDMVPYCPEYHGNEKLKVERFQRMLKDDIRDVISPFKCTTLEDLLSRARKGGGTKAKVACPKCHKFHLGECRHNMPGCYKCRALDHQSKDCTKPMVVCYGCNEIGHRLKKCPNPKAIEARPLRTVKEEKVEVLKPKARVYQMSAEEARSGILSSHICRNALITNQRDMVAITSG